MFAEDAYLPFIPQSLPGRAWLVLAPHADDETFGMGGTLHLHRMAGGSFEVVVLTDGALGGSGPDLVATRERELQAALGVLGGGTAAFWGQPDRGLTADEPLVGRLADRLRTGDHDALFFPAPLEPHPDHRAAAALAWRAARAAGFTGALVSYEISVQGPVACLVDISAAVAAKRRAMQCYVSQGVDATYLERILGLNRARAWSLPPEVTHAEAFGLWHDPGRPLGEALADWFAPFVSAAALGPEGANDRLVACREALTRLQSSRSWRLTRPLRTLARWARRPRS